MKEKKTVHGADAVFVYRNVFQNSLQATVTSDPGKHKPLIIPRTGTSAPIGTPTLKSKPLTAEQ